MRLLKYVKRSGRLKEIEKIEFQSLESKIPRFSGGVSEQSWNSRLGD